MNGNGWTQERRARQKEQIQEWQPWQHATGPKTIHGKKRSALNSTKTGKSLIWRSFIKELNTMLREHKKYLSQITV